MESYAARLLKQVLDKCQMGSFGEIRFISGMSPALVDEAGPHFFQGPDLSKDLVDEIHELCLLLTDDAVPDSETSSTYTFALRRLGRVQCKYQRRASVASLILVRDADAAETVDAIRPTKLPSLRAEAKPDSDRERD